MKQGVYRHPKTDSYYRVLGRAKESTNSRAGDWAIIYLSLTTGELHVREEKEFQERFVYVGSTLS